MTDQAPYPWQQQQWQQLQQANAAGRLPHALLLSGSRGVGKQAFAQALAAYWLCMQPEKHQACGQCAACTLLQAGTHPDVMHIGLSEKSKVIKAEDLRTWLARTQLAPVMHGVKVAIVSEADHMHPSAANSFLKRLEEPAGHTRFILISHAEKPLLPTIKSRCQQWLFPEPELGVTNAWLQTQGVAAATMAMPPLHALAYMQDPELMQQHQQLLETLAQLQPSEVFGLAAKWSKEDTGRIFIWWHALTAALLAQQLGKQPLPTDYAQVQVQALPDALWKFYDALTEAKRIQTSPVNMRLLLDNLLLQWLGLLR